MNKMLKLVILLGVLLSVGCKGTNYNVQKLHELHPNDTYYLLDEPYEFIVITEDGIILYHDFFHNEIPEILSEVR